MAINYTINFSDTAKTQFTIFPFTTNGPISPSDPTLIPQAVVASTTLKLYGRVTQDFGEGMAQNMVYLLENFANSTRPVNSIEGQLWYSTDMGSPLVTELFVRNDNISDIAGGPGWDAIILATGTSVMTGELILSGDPVSALGAAPRQYVDAHISDNILHISTIQNTFLDGLTLTGGPILTSADVNQLIGISSNVQTQLDNNIVRTGDIMDPSANLVFSVGGTVSGLPLSPIGSPPDLSQATSLAYVNSLVATGGDGLLTSTSWLVDNPAPVVAVGDTSLEFTITFPNLTTTSFVANGISRVGHIHAAIDVTNNPAGNIIATNVQTAINELDAEKAPIITPTFTGLLTATGGGSFNGQLTVTGGGSFTAPVTGVLPLLPNEFTTRAYVDALIIPELSFSIDITTGVGSPLTIFENIFPGAGWSTTYLGVGNFVITHSQGIGSPPVSAPGFALSVIFNGAARVLNPTSIDGNSITFQITDLLGVAVEGNVVGRLLF